MNPLFIKEYIILIGVLVIAVGAWMSWKSSAKARPFQRVLMTCFRILGLLALACLAFNPGSWLSNTDESRKRWGFMVDRSRSMQVKDKDAQSRWQWVAGVIGKTVKNWNDAEVYTFSDSIENSISSREAMAQLKPDGGSTDIDKSGLDLLRSHVDPGRIKGVILLSDGHQVVKSPIKDELSLTARAKNVPFYAVPVGGPVANKDLEIIVRKRQYLAFKDQPVKINIELENRNMGNLTTEIQLESLDKKVRKAKLIDSPDNSRKDAVFEMTFDKTGYHDFLVKVPKQKGDSNPKNNLCRIGVAIIDKKLNVLYLEGSPFWDSKFLSQLLSLDKNIKLTTVYRLASDKYMTISSDKEKGRDEMKKTGWPDSLAELKKYDLIIAGKGIEYYLDDDKIAQLKQYLIDHGGALLLARGKPYQRKFPAFALIEPVVWGDPIEGNYYWKPTKEGRSAGLFGNLLPSEDSTIWRKLPAIRKAYRCPKLKTFAEIFAEGHTERSGSTFRFPVIISRKYGRGIVLAVNSEGLWHWDFFPGSEEISRFYREFWIQTVHWLIRHSDFVPGLAYSLNLNRNSVYPGQTVIATVHCRVKQKEIIPYTLAIKQGDRIIQRFTSDDQRPDDTSRSIIFSLDMPGTYGIEFTYTDKGKSETIHSILFVRDLPQERDNLSADPGFLRELAEKSGGRILNPEELVKLVEESGKENVKQVSTANMNWRPYWDKWWILCLILAFFGCECFLRRQNGML